MVIHPIRLQQTPPHKVMFTGLIGTRKSDELDDSISVVAGNPDPPVYDGSLNFG